MKIKNYIALLIFVSCQHVGNVSYERKLVSKYWISENFDYYKNDTSLGGRLTVYGSAYLLNFNRDKTLKYLSADFYWENDSLYLGSELGGTMKSGKWTIEGSNLFMTQKLLYKMFILPGDTLGQVKQDSIKIEADSVLMYKGNKLIPLKTLSNQLKALMDTKWVSQ